MRPSKKESPSKRLYISVFLLVLIMLTSCTSPNAATEGTPQEEPPVLQEISASGEIIPIKWASLTLPNGGNNVLLNVKEGDLVEIDQVLLTITDPRLLSQISQAEAALSRAQINYDLILNSPSELALASAEAALSNALAYHDQLKRNNAAKAQLDAAQADIDSAELNLEDLKKGASDEEKSAALFELEATRSSLEAVKASQTLNAPFTGSVVEIHFNQFESISAYQPIITLADLSEFEVVTTDLSEVDVTRLSVGQGVEILFDAIPNQKCDGKITRIAQRSSGGSAVYYEVHIELEQPPSGLLWGMTAFITFLND